MQLLSQMIFGDRLVYTHRKGNVKAECTGGSLRILEHRTGNPRIQNCLLFRVPHWWCLCYATVANSYKQRWGGQLVATKEMHMRNIEGLLSDDNTRKEIRVYLTHTQQQSMKSQILYIAGMSRQSMCQQVQLGFEHPDIQHQVP